MPVLTDMPLSRLSITILTGAGISAESGVPTFRDALTGLWARFDPMQLATPEAFAREPRLVWEWYAWRRELIAKAVPNAGHHGLVELEARAGKLVLFTQNVDGLHARAGSRALHELHGNIFRSKCVEDGGLVGDELVRASAEVPPRCPRCGAKVRPDVVWFGEALDERILSAAMAAARACDVFVSIGTSTEVYPAAMLPQVAKSSGARLIEINPQPTPITASCDEVIAQPASRGVAELLSRLV